MICSWKYIDFAVSVISHSHLPSTGSSMSVLFCRFTGIYDSSLRLSAGKSSTSASKWTSDTTLLSKLSSGFSPRLSLFVSANVVVVKRINAYSFQSVHVPPIQAILNSEVTTSSERIFLFARNLAHTDASSKFKFDFSAAESSLWISDSSVFCHFSNGFRIQSRVLVTLGQLRSFSVGMFSNNVDWTQSQISDLPTTGSFRMTVKSSKFGVFQSSITNRFGFSAAISTVWTSDSTMMLRIPCGTGQRNLVKLSLLQNGHSYAKTNFSFAKANVAAVSINSSTSGSFVSIIRGNSFGLWSECKQIRTGDTSAPSSYWISDSQMFCKIPSFSESSVFIVAISCDYLLVTQHPVLIRQSVSVSHSSGGASPLTGSNIVFIWGKISPFSRSPSTSLSCSAAASSNWISDSAISSKNGAGSGNVLHSKVSLIDRHVIASNIGFRFQSPSVSGTSPSNAPATGQSFTCLLYTSPSPRD